jgi:hypothetical protein
VFTEEEHFPDDPSQDYTFPQASCRPPGAAPCTAVYDPVAATWSTPGYPTCTGNEAASCQQSFSLNGTPGSSGEGSAEGFVTSRLCESSEECQLDPLAGGAAICVASPLQSCTDPSPGFCLDNRIYACEGHSWAELSDDCVAQGFLCGKYCDPTNPSKPVGPFCSPPVPDDAKSCPLDVGTPATCLDSDTRVTCDFTYRASSDSCGGFLLPHSCSSGTCWNGSSFTSECTCTVLDLGPTPEAYCVANSLLCDPKAMPDSCQGDVVSRCIGMMETQDCAASGEVCMLVNGRAGCAAPTKTACDPSMNPFPTCSGKDNLQGCCPADGVVTTGLMSLLCAPGYLYDQPCDKLTPASNVSCQNGMCTATGP